MVFSYLFALSEQIFCIFAVPIDPRPTKVVNYQYQIMMKKFLLQFCFVSLGFVTVNCQSRSTTSKPTDASVGLESNSCPISLNTTTITYSHHTNSGIAIYTIIKIYEDHLVWEYDEARNDCSLKDSCKYSREEFEELITSLSKVQFSAIDAHDYSVGGSGYGYSFESASNQYFYYDSSYKLLGNYSDVSSLIQQFIKAHKTDCEMIFEKLSRMPHERGSFGEFRTLPEELEKYRVN